MFITATYESQVTGNLEKARAAYELWEQTYPRELRAPSLLAGQILPVFGRYDKAVEKARRTIELNPNFVFGYVTLAAALQALNSFDQAQATLKEASDRKLDIPDMLIQRYDLAFLKGDSAERERLAALSNQKPESGDAIAVREAFTLAFSGHLREAKANQERAAALTRQLGQKEDAAQLRIGPVLWDGFFANAAAARQGALELLALSQSRDVEYAAALALALAGDSSAAEARAADLAKRFPDDTAIRINYLPVLRARIALNHGDHAKAIKLLEPTGPYELGTPYFSYFGVFGALYPVYVRGQAHLAARSGVEAATEFQKILGHRGIVITAPIGALARLQLGRALVLSGDPTKAKGAYQDFFTVWKDADKDIPILNDARAEYSKLQ